MDINQVSQVYTFLFVQIKKNPNGYAIDKEICMKIKSLEIDYANFLLGLIYHYYIVENKKTDVTLLDLVKSVGKKSNILIVPYGGKTHDTGKGPTFDNILTKIPHSLIQLIVAYIKYIDITK